MLKEIYSLKKALETTENCVKSLGIHLGHKNKECYEKNRTSKLEMLEQFLSVWKRRNLTMFGKCTAVNT